MINNEKVYLSEVASSLFEKIDFADTYTTTNHENSIEEIAYMAFGTSPKWVQKLMAFRNSIASLFGLKTELPEDAKSEFKVGGYIAFFKIFEIHENEVVLGADDDHLNFRVILSKTSEETENVKCTTLVEYNNKMGKYYMNIIKPGHKYICNLMVKQAYSPATLGKENRTKLLFI